MKILLLDNYDSFTYNLYQCVKKLVNTKVDVLRNDKISLEEVKGYDKILLSPGPGLPSESGILLPLIKEYAAKKSILGVCLGLQAIGESFGGKLLNMGKVRHGVASEIHIQRRTVKPNDVFKNLPDTISGGRYHSWIVDKKGFPDVLEITAMDEKGDIMALQHKTLDVQGVQFHPESILTPEGNQIIKNWLHI